MAHHAVTTQSAHRSPLHLGRIIALSIATGLAIGIVPMSMAQPADPGERGRVIEAAVPDIQTIFPQLQRRRQITPHWQPVEVRSVDADVVIDGEVAKTTLAITLFNPSSQMARCELAVPVPGEAAISAFSLDGLEGDPPAKLLPRDEARAAFEAIVRKMVDPGLLEFAGYGLIRSSVFPVPPNGEQTFRLTYEQVVDGDGTRVEYELPRSIAAENAPAWDIDLTITGGSEKTGQGPVLSAFSTTHNADVVVHDDGSATINAGNLRDPGPFRVVAMRAQGDGPAMSMLMYPDPQAVGKGFFMLVMAAPEHPADAPRVAREITIVLDRSGSMQGEKFTQATQAAKQVINALGDDESIRIVDYSSEVSSFSVDAGTPDKAKAAGAYLDGLTAVGGTNINEALLTALREPVPAGVLPIVLFLTDGLPTVGITGEKAIRENVLEANRALATKVNDEDGRGRRLFTFGVGHDVNVPLLTDLARATRGVPEFVAPEQDVEAAVGRVFDRLSGPVLTDLSIAGSTPIACGFEPISDMFPRTPGDLFEKQRLIVLGRYAECPGGVSVKVSGNAGAGESVRTIAIDPDQASTKNGHIARLWAQQKITWLIDELQSAGADPKVQQLDSLRDDPRLAELIDEVVHLSTTYGILTEYTSFIAAEDSMLANAALNRAELARVIGGVNSVRSGEAAVQLGQNRLARQSAGGGGGQSPFQSVSAEPSADSAEMTAGGLVLMAPAAKITDLQSRVETISRIRTTVQNVGPDTLYNQRGRWVDANLVNADQQLADPEKDRPAPDETVAFGTDRYFEINFQLAATNRQALMAVPGEVEILLDGKRILLQNPS